MTPNQPELPHRLGDYIVHRLIGRGGMGQVYEAEEQLTRRRVALKLLHTEFGESAHGRRQFVSEMSILARLDDPHIVRCLHCAEIDGQLVMALEYLEGQTLRERIQQRGALAWTEAAGIAWQIAAALRAAQAHRPPIVHRDLKPENVMCLPDGRIKVMDFGIAKMLETLAGTATSQSLGTLQYMSPEQIDARPLDGRSDLFALGLVIWEMLVGRPPFVADSPRVLLDMICTAPAPALPEPVRRGLPPGFEALVFRLLAKDPDARPRDASEVLAALDALRHAPAPGLAPAPAPVQAPSPQPPSLDTVAIVERAARGPERPSWQVPVAVVAVVVVLGVAGAFAWLSLRPDPEQRADPANAAPTAAPTNEPATPACAAHAAHWQGPWTLDTVATEAARASWVGGKGRYELELKVEGCRLSGSGHKLISGRKSRAFEATGEIADDGTATIHYDVLGRDIAGTWTIAKQGSGSWRTVRGDSAGTLTVARGAP